MSLIYQAPAFSGGGPRPGLYLGGKADAKDRDKLDRWNITHILNVTPPKQAGIQAGVPNYFESSGVYTYKRIPVLDASTSSSDLLDKADEIVDFIASGLCHGSVLVHCQRGVSRSTTAIVLYLMRRVGMQLTDAMALVKRRRPTAEPIPAFVKILESYEVTCKQLGAIHSSSAYSAPSKRPMGPTFPPGNSAKRKREIGPAFMGPISGPIDKSRESKSIGVIGPPTAQLQEKPRARAIGPVRPGLSDEQAIDDRVTGQSIGPSLGPQRPNEASPSTEEASSKGVYAE